MMNKRILIIASLLGMLAVILGAFGAHALKGRVTAAELDNWRTAVNYQFFHTLALLFLSCLSHVPGKLVTIASYTFTLGIILFSGSLYLLSTRSITGFSGSILGPITPLGGVFLIIGWFSLFLASFKNK